jgi:hypothetical protein
MTRNTRPRGRPKRAEATAKALEGFDPADVDPRLVLLKIAADTSAPATARVAACRALLQQNAPKSPADDAGENDRVTALAIKRLRNGK